MTLRITMAPTAENPPGTAGHSPRRKSGRARHSVRAVVPRITSSDLGESPSLANPRIPSSLRGERSARVTNFLSLRLEIQSNPKFFLLAYQ